MKNLKIYFFLFYQSILFCFLNPLFAQTSLGVISGKVVNQAHNETIPFTNISYYLETDSLNKKDIQTDAKGSFLLKNLSFGSYTLRFSFIGFQAKTITKLVLDENRFNLNLGNIVLADDTKMLNEVVIEYKKPLVEMQDDKIVYNVDQSIFSEGNVATDILKNVPMVTVDIDGKATIAGKRNTRIMIDGKLSDYNAASIGDLLSTLPSDAIESIELITDPSSKFDADGDGIINIVLKKGKKVGLTGNINSQIGTQGNHNEGFFISKKDTKFSYTANAGFNHVIRLFNSNSFKTNLFSDTSFNDQSNNTGRFSNGLNARIGGSYQIDSLQNLKFSARGGFNDVINNSLSNNLFLNNDGIAQNLRNQDNLSSNNNLNLTIDFDYSLKTKKRGQYAFGLNYAKNLFISNRKYDRYLLNPDGSLTSSKPSLQLNDNENLGNIIQLNADYDKSFAFLNSRLELGLKTDLNFSNESQAVQNFDYNTNKYEFNSSLTNDFDFNQNIYSAYVTVKFKIQKWSFRIGNRAEVTDVLFQQSVAPNINIKPYLNLFPSFAVNRNFKNIYSLGVNYSRRVDRPRQNALNPIIDNSDPQNLRYGNPKLIPSFTDQYELNFSVFKKNWSFSPRISYAKAQKIIERVKTVSSNGDSETTYQNLANNSAVNFYVFGNYQPSKKQTFNAGFTLSKISYTSSANSAFNRNGISIKANIGINYSINKASAFETNLNYLRNTAAQGISNGSVETQFGFKQNLFKNKAGIRFTAVDPFTQKNIRSITEGSNFYQESFSVQKTRNFMLALNYHFTKIEKKK